MIEQWLVTNCKFLTLNNNCTHPENDTKREWGASVPRCVLCVSNENSQAVVLRSRVCALKERHQPPSLGNTYFADKKPMQNTTQNSETLADTILDVVNNAEVALTNSFIRKIEELKAEIARNFSTLSDAEIKNRIALLQAELELRDATSPKTNYELLRRFFKLSVEDKSRLALRHNLVRDEDTEMSDIALIKVWLRRAKTEGRLREVLSF